MKRIGVIALLHESNTFIDSPTKLTHFENNMLVEGDEVIDRFRGNRHEVGGFIDSIEDESNLNLVGTFAARAMPYGKIELACWSVLMQRLRDSIQKHGPFDGLLVAPHGATVAESAADADGTWLDMVRQQVGSKVPIIGTLDLHANVSQKMVDATDALFGYRTNPHLDQREQGLIAGNTMIRTLRGEIAPKQFLVQLPLCVNIEKQATDEPQCQKLTHLARELVGTTAGLIDVSCLYGFPYADVQEMGASVIAVANQDMAIAQSAAIKLANAWYDNREKFVGDLISTSEAVAMAVAHRSTNSSKPVGLLEMGDNVGGGGPGDGTSIVHEWTRNGEGKILTVIADSESVQQCIEAGVGSTLQLCIGGKLSPLRHGAPIEGCFTVRSLSDGRFVEPGVTHGGYSAFDQGTTAVVESDSGITVIVTTHRVGPMSIQQVLSQKLHPNDFAAIVIKGVHAPVAAYGNVCSKLIRVNTNGVTTADLNRLEFHNRRRPMYPWEDTP